MMAASKLSRFLRIIILLAIVLGTMIYIEVREPDLAERAARLHPDDRFAVPGEEYRWGTDEKGRDTFARVVLGIGHTAGAAGIVWIISLVAGTLLGMARSLIPRPFEPFAAMVSRAWFCFPRFFLLAALVVLSGGDRRISILILGLIGAAMVSRRVRETLAQTVAHCSHKAALACGVSRIRLWLNYRFGQAAFTGYREAWAVLPLAVLWEASLGFIGSNVVVSPMGLGNLIGEGRASFPDAPLLVLIPGAALLALLFIVHACEAAIGHRFERQFSALESDDVT